MQDIEFSSESEIKKFQDKKLREALVYLNEKSPFYQKLFARNQINLDEINTIEDLTKIPFTEKHDLQLHNEEFLCVPKEKIIDYITTSGTLGDPVTFGCTDKDLERLAYNEMKSFVCPGLNSENIVQLRTTFKKQLMAVLAYS